MQVVSARDLITAALRLSMVASQNETPTDYQLQQGLYCLQEVLDSWNVDYNMIFGQTIQYFPIESQKQSYSIGPDLTNGVSPPDWIIPLRPQRIIFAVYRPLYANPNPTIDLRLKVLTSWEYMQIVTKEIASGVPSSCYLDQQYPVGNFYLWTEPNQGGFVGLVYDNYLNSTLTLDSVVNVNFPPGYLKALRYELAQNLAPEFGKPMPGDVAAVLQQIRLKITCNNLEAPWSRYDVPTGPGAYDAVTDTLYI
jgi:hypothetical protein